jgi:hypothetical protein
MRLLAAATIVSMFVPIRAWADDKNDCQSAHEQGQLARREGRFDDARAAFATCQADACPAVVRSRCAEFARELETAQPSVVIIVRDPQGAEASGARIRVDGAAPVDVSAMGLRLNPGSHTFVVEAVGFPSVERTITLPEGLKNMQVAFSLARAELPSAEPLARPTSTTAAWAFTITGGVSLVAAGALSGAGWVIHSNLKSSCGAAGCSEGQVEPLRVLWPASFVALGVAAVSGVVATILFATHSSEPVRSALALVSSGGGIRF